MATYTTDAGPSTTPIVQLEPMAKRSYSDVLSDITGLSAVNRYREELSNPGTIEHLTREVQCA